MSRSREIGVTAFLILADSDCTHDCAPAEMPVGVVDGIAGAPVFSCFS